MIVATVLAASAAFTVFVLAYFPGRVRLSDYRWAVVWCKRFSVAFGAAPLS